MDHGTHPHHPTSGHAVRTVSIAFIQVATQRRMTPKGHGGLQYDSTSLSIARCSASPPRVYSSLSQSTLSKRCPPPGLTNIPAFPPNRNALSSTLDPTRPSFKPTQWPAKLPSPPSNTSPQPHDPKVCSLRDAPDDAAGSHRSELHPGNVALPCQASCGLPPPSGPHSVAVSCAVVLTDEKPGRTSESLPSHFGHCHPHDPSTSAPPTTKLGGSRYRDLFAAKYDPNGTFVAKGRDGRCGRPGVYGEADEKVWYRLCRCGRVAATPFVESGDVREMVGPV